MSACDVLVVGAGPTGLTLALALRRLGVACRIIDKSDAASTTSKAIGLQYRVSELLAWLGLVERFAARAAPTGSVNLYAGGARVLALRLGALAHRAGPGAFVPRPLILAQSETEAMLADALAEHGTHVERRTAFVRFAEHAGGIAAVTSTPDGERTIACTYLVSCEGAHSAIRKQAGISFDGKAYPHDFVMADVELDWALAHDDSHAWLHPDGMLSAIAMRGDRRWRLFIQAGQRAHASDEVTLERVQRLFAERTGDRATRATNPTWLTRFTLHSRRVDRFSQGRVFLAGDAAHLHSPSGGQGITTGMQDAFNLAWKLQAVLRDGAPPALLDTYGDERLPIAKQVLRTTDRNTNVLFADGTLGRIVRDRLVFPLLDRPAIQRRMVAKLSQLDQGYRGARLSWERRPLLPRLRAKLRAGDRAPDVCFADPGAPSLFAMLAASRPVAIVTGAPPPALTRALAALGIATRTVPRGGDASDFGRVYGARDRELWLVRPDGYVALCCRSDRLDIARSYLAQWRSPDTLATAFGD